MTGDSLPIFSRSVTSSFDFLDELHVVLGHVLDDLVDLDVGGAGRELLDDAVDVGGGGDDDFHVAARLTLDLVEQEDVGRVGHGDDQRLAVEAQRQDALDALRVRSCARRPEQRLRATQP